MRIIIHSCVSNSSGKHERFFTENSVHQFQCWIYDLHAEYLNFWNFYLEKLLQLASAVVMKIFLFSHFIFFCSYNFLFHCQQIELSRKCKCKSFLYQLHVDAFFIEYETIQQSHKRFSISDLQCQKQLPHADHDKEIISEFIRNGIKEKVHYCGQLERKL